MIIFHAADIHMDRRDHRFVAIRETLRRAVDHARAHRPDLYVISGDLSGKDTAHAYDIAEREGWAEDLTYMAETAPVLIIPGNHDGKGELGIFRRLRSKHPIHVCDARVVYEFAGASVFAVPYMTRTEVLGQGHSGDMETLNRLAAKRLLNPETWDSPKGLPRILIAHGPVESSKLGPYEQDSAEDIVFSPDDLAALRFDYAALGHIHQECEAADKAHYSGSLVPLTFGESDRKGYKLVEVVPGDRPRVEHVVIRSWRMVTEDVTWPLPEMNGHFDGAHVRYRISVPKDFAKERINRDEIRDMLLRRGSLSADIRIEREQAPMPEQAIVVGKRTDEEKIEAAMVERGIQVPQRQRAMVRFAELKAEGVA